MSLGGRTRSTRLPAAGRARSCGRAARSLVRRAEADPAALQRTVLSLQRRCRGSPLQPAVDRSRVDQGAIGRPAICSRLEGAAQHPAVASRGALNQPTARTMAAGSSAATAAATGYIAERRRRSRSGSPMAAPIRRSSAPRSTSRTASSSRSSARPAAASRRCSTSPPG